MPTCWQSSSDEETRRHLAAQGREEDWRPLAAEANASYGVEEEIDLSALEPLIALPSSPGKVVPMREVEGQDVHQSYIGSSANPGYRDIAVVAAIVSGPIWAQRRPSWPRDKARHPRASAPARRRRCTAS